MSNTPINSGLTINGQYTLPDTRGNLGQSFRIPQTGTTLEWFTSMAAASNLTQLLSGAVIWQQDLDFEVSYCQYYILGVFHTSATDIVTLDAADTTNPRIDVIYVDEDGLVGFITGTPNVNPAKPIVDGVTQLELTSIYVAANDTIPTGITTTVVYDENVEWTTSSSQPANTTVNFASLIDPKINTKCVLVSRTGTGGVTGTSLNFVTNADLDVKNSTIAFYVKTSATWDSSKNWIVVRLKHDNIILANVLIYDGSCGFHSSNDDWQRIILNLPTILPGFTTNLIINTITITFGDWNSALSNFNIAIDDIEIQNGIVIIPNNTIIEDITFEFRDVSGNVGQTYFLDLQAYYNYKVIGATLQLDTGSCDISIKINSTAITNLDEIGITSVISNILCTTNNQVNIDDSLSLTFDGFTSLPTLIRGKIKLQRF